MTEGPSCYFIRHGETDWNAAARMQGRAETDLNAKGRAQARAIARRLREVEPDVSGFSFYASPMRRVRQTLAPILAACGLEERDVIFDDRLREKHFGVCEGMTWRELLTLAPDPFSAPEAFYHWRPEGGESYADVAARLEDFLAGMRTPAVIVAHGGVSRVVRGWFLGLPEAEVATLKVPQDRFMRLWPGGMEWIEASPR